MTYFLLYWALGATLLLWFVAGLAKDLTIEEKEVIEEIKGLLHVRPVVTLVVMSLGALLFPVVFVMDYIKRSK